MSKYPIIFVFLAILMANCSTIKNENVPSPKFKYYLYDIYENSDIDYNKIDSIDTYDGGKTSMLNVFQPKEGDYKIIRYMSYDYGPITMEFCDSINYLMILKVDKRDIIVDGFICFLQSAEYPFSLGLLRTKKKQKLKDRMTVKSMNFEPYRKIEDIGVPQYVINRSEFGIVLFKSKE